MKLYVAAFAALLAFAGAARAQEGDMEKNYKEKMAKEFTTKVKWESKLAEAMAKAKTEKKLVFGYFSRSYAP